MIKVTRLIQLRASLLLPYERVRVLRA